MADKELFYANRNDILNDKLILRRDELQHLIYVCRKKVGDFFIAVDGAGNAFDCEIESYDKKTVTAKILKKTRQFGEPLFKLTLAPALFNKVRFEWMIEKATEIGAVAFIPVITERSTLPENALKPQRLGRIAIAAMKQSCRSIVPSIASPTNFQTLCENSSHYAAKFIAHEKETHPFEQVIRPNQSTSQTPKSGLICIGPEGGFTDDEIHMAKSYGFSVFGLGPRRLRSETAAIVTAGLLLHRMGELS